MLLTDSESRVVVLENADVIRIIRTHLDREFCVCADTSGGKTEVILGCYPTREIAEKMIRDMLKAYERGDAVFRFPSEETATYRAMPETILNYCKSEGTSEE